MTRRLRHFVLVLVVAGIAACGPPRKSVFPPSVSLQQVKVMQDGQWELTVRIQNNSYGEMDFSAIDGQLQIAELVPVRLHGTFARQIPALVGDVVTLDILPTPPMQQALTAVAAKGSGDSVAYRVSGRASARPEQEKQVRDFDFSGTDLLSPVPGVPNTFR